MIPPVAARHGKCGAAGAIAQKTNLMGAGQFVVHQTARSGADFGPGTKRPKIFKNRPANRTSFRKFRIFNHLQTDVYRVRGIFPVMWSRHANEFPDQYGISQALMQISLEPQKLEILGRLTGSLLHDLNNMLTVIQLNASMIAEGLPAAHASQLAEEITKACGTASQVTRSVLSFLRGDSEEKVFFEAGRTLRECRQILQGLIARKTELTVDIPEREFWVKGHPSHLTQAVMNLLFNAVDASPKHGIHLAAKPLWHAGREHVEILVRDTGDGIPPGILPRIFEAFFTTKAGVGTGLGLHIVKTVAEDLGGRVDVSSEPGQGSSFRLILPCCPPPAGAGQPRAESLLGAPSDQTILWIEDDAGIRQVGRRILEGANWRVLEAADVSAARALWQKHQDVITLVLTDIILPGPVSGYHLAQEFLRTKTDLPVIYTSGNNEAARELEGLTEDNFLPKPFRPADLTRLVRQHCAGRTVRSTAPLG
jgi:Signal transduction histidine kinase